MLTCRRLGQRGMSLVELMVAMVISLIILGGVYQVFTGSTSSSRENEQFARLQENARFAMEVLGRNIRMAGYAGCFGGTASNNLDPLGTGYTALTYGLDVAIEGHDWDSGSSTWIPALDAAIVDEVSGTDVLIVRGKDDTEPIAVDTPYMTSTAANLHIVDGTSLSQGDVVMVSDCTSADIFQINSNPASGTLTHSQGNVDPGNVDNTLETVYEAGAEVVRYVTNTYYIKNNPAGIPSLYRMNTSGTVELIQGVENMQVRYGIDNVDDDRQVDDYVVASPGLDWSQVVAVRVALLMRSDTSAKAPIDTNSYDLDGDGAAEYNPADDRRMRRVFKATFALRNRVS